MHHHGNNSAGFISFETCERGYGFEWTFRVITCTIYRPGIDERAGQPSAVCGVACGQRPIRGTRRAVDYRHAVRETHRGGRYGIEEEEWTFGMCENQLYEASRFSSSRDADASRWFYPPTSFSMTSSWRRRVNEEASTVTLIISLYVSVLRWITSGIHSCNVSVSPLLLVIYISYICNWKFLYIYIYTL